MSTNLANKTSAQSITSTAAALTFDATLTNESLAFELSPQNTRATVQPEYDGRYGKVSAQYSVNFTYNEIDIRKNGASFLGAGRYLGFSAGSNAGNAISAPVLLSENDYFEAFLRNISTTADTQDNELNWLQLYILPVTFSGALVYKSATQTIVSSDTWTALSWDNESYDLNSFHSTVTNNSRLTVPLGVSLVRISQGTHRSNSSSAQLEISAAKNGSIGGVGIYNSDTSGDSSIAHYLTGMSAPLAVSSGDYFEAYCFSSQSNTVIQNSDYTWFAIEVLPSNLKYALVNRTTNQAISSQTETIVSFNSEVADVGGWYDGGTSTQRFVVPSGVKKVRLIGNVNRASATGQAIAYIFKNGALFAGGGRKENDTAGQDFLHVSTGVIPVSPGDYFDLRVWFNTASNITGGDNTWFSIEEVQDDAITLTPVGGTSLGGTPVTITGDGFLDATGVLFDTDSATSFTIVSNTTITCVTPAHADGFVDVTVQKTSGDIVLSNAFSYSSDLPPVFISVSPDKGRTTGGTPVTLTGENLSTVTSVYIGGNPVDNLVVVNDTTLTFDTPPGTVGPADIDIYSTAGNINVDDAFDYIPFVRVTQLPILVLTSDATPTRVTQLPILVVAVPPQPTRVTQLPIQLVFPFEAEQVFPMIPQWPIEESLEWSTTIVSSRFGFEQRMGVRVEPDVSMAYSIPILNSDMRMQAFHTLYRYIGKNIEYPMFQYITPLNSGSTAGSTTLDLDVRNANLRVGEPIYIFDKRGTTWQRAIVAALSESPLGATLLAPLAATVNEGDFVAPAPAFRFPDGQSFTFDSSENGVLTLPLLIATPRNLLRDNQDDTVQTYDNIPLLPDRWIAGSNASEAFTRNVTSLDATSNRTVSKGWLTTQRIVSRSFFVEKENLDYWRAWLSAVNGRRVPFLMPTYQNDMNLSVAPSLGATELVTEDTQIAEYMKSTGIRRLMIRRKDGSIIYRRVVQCFLDMNRTVRLTLDANIGASAGNNEIDMISLLNLTRLASDRVALSHYTNHIELKFSTQTVDR